MTLPVLYDQLDLASGEGCFRIQMRAPRANALEPGLLDALHRAFDDAERSGCQKLVLTGGRHFSSGGDVRLFLDAAESAQAGEYAQRVVPDLQDLILRMISAPMLIASVLRGAATGGGAGMIFASDLVACAPDAFVQPYYGVMGFAPDGGWTATLPELVPPAVARGWIFSNDRKSAWDLKALGLAQAVDADPGAHALDLLDGVDIATALCTKSLFWTDDRIGRVSQALEAETRAFLRLIDRPQTVARMTDFLKSPG